MRHLLGAGGVDVNAREARTFYSHATPLHHAVSGGSLPTVDLLVAAGARLDARDTAYDGTPLDWAKHSGKRSPYAEIAHLLARARRALSETLRGENHENETLLLAFLLPFAAHAQTREAGPWWPHPEWGAMDQAGASNRITPEKIVASMRLVQTGRVYEIGQVYERGMPLGGHARFRAAARAGHRADGAEPRALQRRVPLGRGRPGRHAVRRARPHRRRGPLRRRHGAPRVLQRLHDGRDERGHGAAAARHRALEADPHARRADRLAGLQERATPRRRLRGHARRRARRARAARHRRELDHARRRGAVPLRLGAALEHARRVHGGQVARHRPRGRALARRAQDHRHGRRHVDERGLAEPERASRSPCIKSS